MMPYHRLTEEEIANRELLSLHETKAVFNGTVERKCMHLTSLCPDRCHHGGTYAHFLIDEYVKYEKPGEYGDAEGKDHMIKLEEAPEDIVKIIEGLNKGDKVILNWRHDYITTKEGGKFPERPTIKLEKI